MSVHQETRRQLPADALEFSVVYSSAKGDSATAPYHYTPRVPVIYWATFLIPNFPGFIIESGELPTRDLFVHLRLNGISLFICPSSG